MQWLTEGGLPGVNMDPVMQLVDLQLKQECEHVQIHHHQQLAYNVKDQMKKLLIAILTCVVRLFEEMLQILYQFSIHKK